MATENTSKLTLLNAKKEILFSKINRIYQSSKSISNFDSRSNEKFMSESETVKELRDRYEELIDQINLIMITLKPDAAPDYQQLAIVEDLYSSILRVRNKIINDRSLSASTSTATAAGNSALKKYVHIPLPPIELHSFNGEASQWPRFYESFKANVHENEQLTNAQKVQYLVGKLNSAALKITAGIVPSGDTYETIWQSLVNRYQDIRALGTFYLNNILDIKPCMNTSVSLDNFIENYAASIAALKQLKIPDLTDFVLLNCALRKLDTHVRQSFELSVRDEKIPSSKQLISFVQDQVKILEMSNNKPALNNPRPRISKTFITQKSVSLNSPTVCSFCRNNDHVQLYKCKLFQNSNIDTRFQFIKQKKGCINCLSISHARYQCKSKHVCDKCGKQHHTLLHFTKVEDVKNSSPAKTEINTLLKDVENDSIAPHRISASVRVHDSSCTQPARSPRNDLVNTNIISNLSFNAHSLKGNNILLATAQIFVSSNKDCNKKICRCLLDNGSQSNLITIDCCKQLNLSIIPLSNSFVKGVGAVSKPIHGYVFINIESRVFINNKYKIQALVVDSITDQLPSHFVDSFNMSYLNNIPLADLTWNLPGSIDIVIGAELFPYIYLGNKIDSGPNTLPAVLTAFGYVLMGECPNIKNDSTAHTSDSFCALALNDLVQKFWQLDEIPNVRYMSPEETECENLYITSVNRDTFGRYTVGLPFSEDVQQLGNSRNTAYRRLMSLERKFKQNPDFQKNYNKVINDYIENNYLSEVDPANITDDGYYIPHHAVVRPDKPMPRIVLDASASTHTGVSLNEVLHTGPNLQADLFLLLLDFRLFPIAITADIKQMYLQINVQEKDRKFLRILYRLNGTNDVRTFQFDRLPFGLKCSPYLAMRTMRQLALDMKPHFPIAAEVIEKNFYMDDLVHSISNEDNAIRLAHDMISVCKSGAFDLIKWTSNSHKLLDSLPHSHCNSVNFNIGNDISKVLGLSWEPVKDHFYLTVSEVQEKCTKRNILSIVARLFDVLGLVAPVILYAKLLIKELWLCNIGWDETPPDLIICRFSAFIKELPLLSSLQIPRHIGISSDSEVRLVAFCDASMNGYGSVIYMHATDPTGHVTVRLLCAKSKVSPTKVTTLARLELCAAVLMSKLIKTVSDTYNFRISIKDIYAFSDSTIALAWIHSLPHRWSVFVSNRIVQCHENLAPQHFYHISGSENPSDCLSRGVLPSQLLSNDLWWKGPSWLSHSPSEWPIKTFSASSYEELPERRSKILTTTVVIQDSILHELSQRISSWGKLLRIIIYVLRFIKRLPPLSSKVKDFIYAEKYLIKSVQQRHFYNDIELIKKGKAPSKRLLKLSVFLDENDILRIGGRLTHSDLPFESKHPMLLPKHDHVVDIIIRHYHDLNCHTGPALLMSILRQRFWILDARTVVRSIIRKCNFCFRVKPTHPTPKMADLPAFRVLEAKAFVHTGVDYAGPLRITLSRRRGQHSQKAYICLFVCLVTKAIHIELTSDLTSDSFLAAFKRFISRRGPVSCLYSDNGTNFIGAKTQLNEMYKFITAANFQSHLKNYLLSHRIEWKMIPPRAPHFGSMWESNIKSLKTHLFRVVGNQLLTFEELQTVLIQIECILNSRPLSVISSDPDPEVITPAHFLMSTPLQYLPASNLSDSPINLVQRKFLLDSMVQSFWKKWRSEYLHTLQVRQKWASPDKPINVGTVVLIHQDDSPPLYWPLGVITDVHPGADKVIRVATIKNKFGCFKRPVIKLYPLPNQ